VYALHKCVHKNDNQRLCTHYTIVPIVRVLRSLRASLRYAWGVRYAHRLCRAGGTVQRVIDSLKSQSIYSLKICFLLATQARSILVAQLLIYPLKTTNNPLPKKHRSPQCWSWRSQSEAEEAE